MVSGFYYIDESSFNSYLFESLLLEAAGSSQIISLFASELYDIIIFSFSIIDMMYYVHWLAFATPFFHILDEYNLVMVYDFLSNCWILFANILLRIFASELNPFISGSVYLCYLYFGGVFFVFWFGFFFAEMWYKHSIH